MSNRARQFIILLSGGGAAPALVDLTSFNQTLGSNIVNNGTFTTDTTGWSTAGGVDVFEATGGRAHVVESAAATTGFNQTVTVVAGTLYMLSLDFEVVSGTLRVDYITAGLQIQALTGSGTVNRLFVATVDAMILQFRSLATPSEFYIDNVAVQPVTMSAVQTTLANATSEVIFAQEASPELNDQVSLVYRRVDADDYWLVNLRYTLAAQWDIVHQKVVSGVVTTLQTGSNVGTGITGLRVIANGNNHTIYSQSAGVWSIVGSMQTDAANNTGTGLTALYTPGMTPSRLYSVPN